MKNRQKSNILIIKNFLIGIILCGLISACSQILPATPNPTSLPAERATATLSAVPPTSTTRATIPPTTVISPEPTPTPKPMTYQGTESISLKNAAQVALLGSIGEGVARDLAWLADGQNLAVCGSLGLDIFNLEPFKRTQRLLENSACSTVAVSPGNDTLAIALPDGSIRLLDTQNWQEISKIQTDLPAIYDLGWSPDGQYLAVSGMHGNALLYPSPLASSTRKPILIAAHTQGHVLLAWSADSQQIATGTYDGRLTLWNAQDGTFVALLHGHQSAIESLAWSQTGNQLASASEDGSLLLWDTENQNISQTLSGSGPVIWENNGKDIFFNHEKAFSRQSLGSNASPKALGTKPIQALEAALSPDDKYLAVVDQTGALLVLNTGDGKVLETYPRYGLANTALAISPDGSRYASLHANGSFDLWEAVSGKHLATIENNAIYANQLIWSPDGELLALYGEYNAIRIFDLETQTFIKDLELPIASLPSGLAWSPDSTAIAVGLMNGDIYIWNHDKWFRREPLETHSEVISALAWSPDGDYLAIGSELGVWRYWDLASNQSQRRVEGHAAVIQDIAFSPKQNFLATASADGNIFIWDLQGYTIKQRLGNPDCPVNRVLWSPDGTLIASVDSCGHLNIWNPDDGSLINSLGKSLDPYYGLVWSSDGKTLISAGLDGSLWLWGIPQD